MAPALVPSLLAQRLVAGGDQFAATLFELIRRGRYRMTAVTRERSSLAGLRAPDRRCRAHARHKEQRPERVEKPVAAIFIAC